MTEVNVALIGANHPSLFQLVANFRQTSQWHFSLFGVGQPVAKVPANGTYQQAETLDDAVTAGLTRVAAGECQVIFKGIVQTHKLLKALLRPEFNLKKQSLLSHVALLELPDLARPVLLSDAGMNIAPNSEQLAAIVNNAVYAAHAIGNEKPKVALLSSAENYNPKMPSSVLTRQVTTYFQQQPIAAEVFGPISLDLALSPMAVQKKAFQGPIAGDADILIVPNIDAGNILYKALMLFTPIQTGGVIIGAKVPVVLPSRSDQIENKAASLRFATQLASQ